MSCFSLFRILLIWAVLVPAVAMSAACQPVPQPFRSVTPEAEPLAKPTRQAGLLVRAVPGAADPAALAERIAEALRRLDVNATTLGANRGSYLLTGEARTRAARDGMLTVTIDWLVSDPRGRAIGRHVQESRVSETDWRTGDDRLAARIASDASDAIAPLMADARAPSTAEPILTVHGVDGAPGDGDVSLRRALAYTLSKQGFRVVEGLADADVVIAGAVRVSPADDGSEEISIVWTALRPDGAELGTVEQSNRVPRGSLAPTWGVTALRVAEAATPGLMRLIAASGQRIDGRLKEGTETGRADDTRNPGKR